MAKSPTRKDKAEVDLKVLAMLSYILTTGKPELYLVLETIKVLGYISDYVTITRVNKILKMNHADLMANIQELRHREWIAEDRGYMRVLKSGDKKLASIRAKIAMLIEGMI